MPYFLYRVCCPCPIILWFVLASFVCRVYDSRQEVSKHVNSDFGEYSERGPDLSFLGKVSSHYKTRRIIIAVTFNIGFLLINAYYFFSQNALRNCMFMELE
jgi:hypothetical protein